MEKIIYDSALDDVIKIIEQRIELYEDFEINVAFELQDLISIIQNMKYYK